MAQAAETEDLEPIIEPDVEDVTGELLELPVNDEAREDPSVDEADTPDDDVDAPDDEPQADSAVIDELDGRESEDDTESIDLEDLEDLDEGDDFDELVPELITPAVAAPAIPRDDDQRVNWAQRRRLRTLRARRVRRTIRSIDAWSVFKTSLVFLTLFWVSVMIAGVLLWSAAVNSGQVESFESFVTELFDLKSFSIEAELLFSWSARIGAAFVVVGSLLLAVWAMLFNLVSDLLGGIRLSVVEEESAHREVR